MVPRSTRVLMLLGLAASVLTSILSTAVITSRSATAAPTLAVGQPMVAATVLPVSCASAATFDTTFTKALNVGTFTVQRDGSLVELTFYGRIFASTLTSSNGALFELRVDDTATTNGRARALLRAGEAGGVEGVNASMSGIFSSLAAGNHIASIWVRATNTGGSGTFGGVDPGCFSSDHLVIKEYVPFGTVALPFVSR